MSGSCKSCGAPMVSSDLCDRCSVDPDEDYAGYVAFESINGRQPVGTYAEYRP